MNTELAVALGGASSSIGGGDVPALLRHLLNQMQAPASQQPPGKQAPFQDAKQQAEGLQAEQVSGLGISELSRLHSQLGHLQGGLGPLLRQAVGQQHVSAQQAEQHDAAMAATLEASAAALVAQVHAARAANAGGGTTPGQLLPALPSASPDGTALEFLAKFAPPGRLGGLAMTAGLWQEASPAFAGSASKAGALRQGACGDEQPEGFWSPPAKRVRWQAAGGSPRAGSGQAAWEEAELEELSFSEGGSSAVTEACLKEHLQTLRLLRGGSRLRQEAAIGALVETLLGSANKRLFAELYMPWLRRAGPVRLARECATLVFYLAMAEAGMEWQVVRWQALAYLQGSMRRMLRHTQQAAAAAEAAAGSLAAGASSKAPEQAQVTTPTGTAMLGCAGTCALGTAAVGGSKGEGQADEAISSSTGGGGTAGGGSTAGGDGGGAVGQLSTALAPATAVPLAATAAC